MRIACLFLLATLSSPAFAQDPPRLSILWPPAGATIPLGSDGSIGVVVSSNFALEPAGQCGDNPRCGHVHMRIDPDGTDCMVSPDKPYNSMNSDRGGDLIKARFDLCEQPAGPHVIGVLLADDRHQPIVLDGQPITALVSVTTTQ